MQLKNEINLNAKISKTSELIDEALVWENYANQKPREYLGISLIGHHCSRYLWLYYHWFAFDYPEGRILRIFRRGQREEEVLVQDLEKAGLKTDYTLSNQLDIDFGSHVKGHPDGICKGVPEAPEKIHVLEFKTHNNASFGELKRLGVKKAKPMHYSQMQCEMLGASMVLKENIDRALYVAVNKDNDELYTERVDLDKTNAEALIVRGQDIATTDYIPAGISTRSDWYECKMCCFHDFCHGELLPEINCRTCGFFTSDKDGKCYCDCYDHKEIPYEAQRKGCPCHVFHPDMVKWKNMPCETQDCVLYEIPGFDKPVLNGWQGYSSGEIKAAIKRGEHETERIPDQIIDINF